MCRYWIWMWELDYKEGWALKNWCFRTMVLKKTLESPLDSKEIKPVNPKGNQPWIFIGRTDAKALKFCWLMQRADSLEKTLLLGKIESKRRKRWQRMRWLVSITNSIDVNVRELQEIDSEGQRSLAGFSPGVTKSRTGLNNWTELKYTHINTHTHAHVTVLKSWIQISLVGGVIVNFPVVILCFNYVECHHLKKRSERYS